MAFVKIAPYSKSTGVVKPKKAGQKAIRFHKGGLHESTGTPANERIPAAKKVAALAGKFGPKARAQANFAKNVLTGKK